MSELRPQSRGDASRQAWRFPGRHHRLPVSTFAPPLNVNPTAGGPAESRGGRRARERSLLLANLLILALAILAAWAPLRGSRHAPEALLAIARELAPLWLVFLLVHAALAVRRIESDEYLL